MAVVVAAASFFGFATAASQAQTTTSLDLVLGGEIIPGYTPAVETQLIPGLPPMYTPATASSTLNTLVSSSPLEMVEGSTRLAVNISFADGQMLNLLGGDGYSFTLRIDFAVNRQAFSTWNDQIGAPGTAEFLGVIGSPMPAMTPGAGSGVNQFILAGSMVGPTASSAFSKLSLSWAISNADPTAVISVSSISIRLTDTSYDGSSTVLPELLSFSPAPIPEPSSMMLLGLGVLGGAAALWRRRRL